MEQRPGEVLAEVEEVVVEDAGARVVDQRTSVLQNGTAVSAPTGQAAKLRRMGITTPV